LFTELETAIVTFGTAAAAPEFRASRPALATPTGFPGDLLVAVLAVNVLSLEDSVDELRTTITEQSISSTPAAFEGFSEAISLNSLLNSLAIYGAIFQTIRDFASPNVENGFLKTFNTAVQSFNSLVDYVNSVTSHCTLHTHS
jgi:hypothetical protein